MTNWQYGTAIANGQQPVQGGGGGQVIYFRDPLDARRAMQGQRVPTAEYPDGYLGTINSRREDRLLNALKGKLNQRSYQRGVHKGERIDPGDYMWPPEFGPMTGIERQATTGLRAAPLMTVAEQLDTYGSGAVPRGAASLMNAPPNAMAPTDLRQFSPTWK